MDHSWVAQVIFVLDLFLRLYFGFQIIRRRLPVGVAWAWIGFILYFPLFGTFIYLFLGEYRVGRRRIRRLHATEVAIRRLFASSFEPHDHETELPANVASFARGVRGFFECPFLSGNDIELLHNAEEAFEALIRDIDQAKISCDMEFYIWSEGGRADDFGEALIRAAGRGVRCRLLVDQIGSAKFLRGAMAKRLRTSGVEVWAALPSGIIRSFFARPDLRIHRKILVIDGEIGFTGSLNIADPKLFKIAAGVGQWVDALCRVRGPSVKALGLVFLSDWCVEKNLEFSAEERKLSFPDTATRRTAHIQCMASGPAVKNSAIEEVLIMALYSAQKKLILTTPYFVPSEALFYALVASARKGVEVTLIVPAKVDSKMTHFASRAFLQDLVEAGVRVAFYNGGMLHTKSVTIDEDFSLFGSLNLDPRSLRINFEITLAIYDQGFVKSLVGLQESYLKDSTYLDLATCAKQGWRMRFVEDVARLAGPIL